MNKPLTALWIGAILGIIGFGTWLVWPGKVMAHCDTMDGPVIMEAKDALTKGDVTPLLKWVKQEHESAIKTSFANTLTVRAKGPEAKALADTYFFETLVRLHREGEGAPFTGLKPAGEVEPPIAEADRAIAEGDVDELAREIGQAAEKSVRERFEHLIEAQKHKDQSVEAGREYVEAYVQFVHHVEGLHKTIAGGIAHHE